MNYYLFGVGIKGIHSDKPGEKELDFFIQYTDEDIEKAKLATEIKNNEMWQVSGKEAIDLVGATVVKYMPMISIRAAVHGLMVCLYKSDDELTREFFSSFVEYTDFKELEKAKVRI